MADGIICCLRRPPPRRPLSHLAAAVAPCARLLLLLALLHAAGQLGPAPVTRAGKIFHSGEILEPFIDTPRRSKRRYPYGNSTATSLNQYREEVRNGNDYNMVGENVGEGTIFSDDVENIAGAYVRHFTSAPMTGTQGEISVARFDMAVETVGKKIIFAGGVLNDMSGGQSAIVDVYNSVRAPYYGVAQPVNFSPGKNAVTLVAMPVPPEMTLAVPAAPARLLVTGIGIVYGTWVSAINTATRELTLACPPRGLDANPKCTNAYNTGTQLIFKVMPDTPLPEEGAWDDPADAGVVSALSVARQGIASCSDDTSRKAFFAGGFAVLPSHVEVTPFATVDIITWDVNFQTATLESQTLTPTVEEPGGRPRYDMGAAFLDGKAYFAGGVQGLASTVTMLYSRRVDVYDVATDSWSLLKGPPVNKDIVDPEGMYTARASFAMVACPHEKLVIFAGGTSKGRYFRLAEATEYLTKVDIFDAL